MNKQLIIVSLIFLFLITSVYAIDISAEVETIENSIYLDEKAVFKLNINNTDSYSKVLSIYTQDIKWYVDIEPSLNRIGAKTIEEVELTIVPSAWAEQGAQIAKVIVESPNTDEKITLQLPIFVKSYGDKKDYSPSVELRVSFPESINPKDTIPVELHLRNRNRLDIDDLRILIKSSYFEDQKNFPFGPLAETREKIIYQIPATTKPAQDKLEITLIINNETINKETVNYNIVAYSEFVTKGDTIVELFKKTTEYTVVNEGNINKADIFSLDAGFFERFFINSKPNHDLVNFRQQTLEWELSLEPMQEIQITVTKNFRPAIYLLLIVVLATMMYFIYRSPVLIKKDSVVIDPSDEGISKLKILLHVRNRSPDLLENLTLTDLIPAMSTFLKTKYLGSMAPSKILKHMKKGTLVKWKLDALEPFEERIISYQIKTKMTIVGGLTLPNAKIKFRTKKGTDRIVKSNKSQVNFGL